MKFLLKIIKTHSLFLLLILASYPNTSSLFVKGEDSIPITPNEEFFTTAIDSFDIDPEKYRLTIVGRVINPLNLSLEEIKALPKTTEIVRLTCIGYKYGATSMTGVANWTGTKLSEVLNLAQIDLKTAVDVILRTSDHSSGGYSTSLKIEEAYWDDVILAYEMNGVPLPVSHGFPIRLVCPRFYGYKWIKWLTFINVTDMDYLGYWESTGRYEDSPFVDVGLPIYYPLNNSTNSKQGVSWVESQIISVVVLISPIALLYTVRRLKKK